MIWNSFISLLSDVKQYPNLIKTLSYLLKRKYNATDSLSAIGIDGNANLASFTMIHGKLKHFIKTFDGSSVLSEAAGAPMAQPVFVMSWRRRIGKEDELLFFTGCENAGLEVKHLGSRVYCIKSME